MESVPPDTSVLSGMLVSPGRFECKVQPRIARPGQARGHHPGSPAILLRRPGTSYGEQGDLPKVRIERFICGRFFGLLLNSFGTSLILPNVWHILRSCFSPGE
jgi:hypothetical protein